MTRPLLALALALAGCDAGSPTADLDDTVAGADDTGPGDIAPPVPGDSTRKASALTHFASCDEVDDRLIEVFTEALVQARYGHRGRIFEDGAQPPAAGGAEDDAPTDYTTTNVQEAGVDELDLVKMGDQGRLMLVAQDRALQLVDTWPIDEARLHATLPLDGWARGLFVHGDTAIVVSNVDGTTAGLGEDWRGVTRVTLVDVSDPADPVVTRTTDVQGWVADARMVDDDVFLVLHQWIDLPDGLWDLAWDETIGLPDEPVDWDDEDAWDAAADAARDILAPLVADHVAGLDLEALLPQWRLNADAAPEAIHDCTDLYAPEPLGPLSMLTVAQLSVDDGTVGAAGLMADGWTVYASRSTLYVAQSSGGWWRWDGGATSQVHAFALDGDAPVYTASGSVSGYLYDQFAMSEYDGVLRVVTTDVNWWGWWGPDEDREEAASHVYVLDDDGEGALAEIGHVGGIAPGEQVRSVRMLGEKGYVVTFEQIDPLFTVDLSDPTDPRVVGELKIPGFSAYMHPMGDDHLLAVGMAGTDEGQLTGLAVNVFDVSDFADPQLLHAHEIDPPEDDAGWTWSWSEALWDHHAFTFHRDTLTIPMMSEHYDEGEGRWEGFSGTASFHVTPPTGITEVGRVEHSDLVADSACLYDRWDDWYAYGSCSWDWGWWGSAQVRRSVYIEDNLFTISAYGVKINDLAHPSLEHGRVLFWPER